MKNFLQIGRAFQENYGEDYHANFKCMGCLTKFFVNVNPQWKYCPECGSQIFYVFQDIPIKKYRNNAGYNTRIDGKWVQFIPPTFTLIVETLYADWNEKTNSLGEKKWHTENCYPITGDHQKLRWNLKHYKYDKETRYRLIPNKVLPLP